MALLQRIESRSLDLLPTDYVVVVTGFQKNNFACYPASSKHEAYAFSNQTDEFHLLTIPRVGVVIRTRGTISSLPQVVIMSLMIQYNAGMDPSGHLIRWLVLLLPIVYMLEGHCS